MLSWAPKATRSSRYHFRQWHACVGTAKSPPPTKEKIGKYLIKFMLKEKFAPYWDNKVQNAWVAFLHDMLDNDPTTHIGPRQAWRNVSSLLEKLDITGFGSGLTPFQLATLLHWKLLSEDKACVSNDVKSLVFLGVNRCIWIFVTTEHVCGTTTYIHRWLRSRLLVVVGHCDAWHLRV